MYRIIISQKVAKELKELDNKTYLKIRDRIFTLENDPRPIGSTKLTAMNGYRIRCGMIRILYEIDDKNNTVTLLRIAHRREVYK